MDPKATERPWRIGEGTLTGGEIPIMADVGDRHFAVAYVASVYMDPGAPANMAERVLANARLIVRAVNSHDAMRTAIRDYVAGIGSIEALKSTLSLLHGVAIFEGRTVADLEREAEKLGARNIRYELEGGGVERLIYLSGRWIVLTLSPVF